MRFPQLRHLLHRHPEDRLRTIALWVPLVLASAGAAAFGQDDEARSGGWGKVELAAEARSFKEAMRGGGAFDAAARGFLEQIALPQLELESNRGTIERVRRRMREFLLGDIVNEKAADDANKAVLAFMQSLAEKQDAEPVVRVNAMLMIGELQGVDRKPLQSAAAVLARAVANTDLPKALRIAACVGLARHVEATKGLVDEQQRLASVANPAIVAVLEEPASGGANVEDDWLASRCLSMLPLLGAAPPATIAKVTRLLVDESRSINVRVRAAAALAVAAGPDAKLDTGTVIPAVGRLAVASLRRDVAAADGLLLERQVGIGAGLPGARPLGPSAPGMIGDPLAPGQPPEEQLIPREVCRRAAWRLAVLADAILTDDAKRGLAVQVADEDAKAAARLLAQKLRRAALELDAAPEEATIRQVLADLDPPAPAAGQEPAEKPDASGDKQ